MTPAKEPFIAIAGNIAVGKSGLVRNLAKMLDARPLYEDVDRNPFFDRFYASPGQWAFSSQVAFLADSLERHTATLDGGAVVQDRTAYETVDVFGHLLHERGHLSDDHFAVLRGLRNCATGLPRQPTLLIFLHAPTDVLIDRISRRSRTAENHIQSSYLDDLNSAYAEFIASWTICPVFKLDSNIHDLRRPEVIQSLLPL